MIGSLTELIVISVAVCLNVSRFQVQLIMCDLYRELLPLINSGRCELLDHPKLISQLTGLERRTARGGRDSIDHAPGAHDDVANAVAGALLAAHSAHKQRIVAVATFMGGLGPGQRLPPARYFDPATGRTLRLVDPVSGRVLYDVEQPRISALSASNNGCNPGKGINPPSWLDSIEHRS
jgi:hypothetical protein